jgi:hypothetical protein
VQSAGTYVMLRRSKELIACLPHFPLSPKFI